MYGIASKTKKLIIVYWMKFKMPQNFESVLNGFLKIPNLDVYVTGSNPKFLSSDMITEFRGRGDEIKFFPLTFSDFLSAYNALRNKLGILI